MPVERQAVVGNFAGFQNIRLEAMPSDSGVPIMSWHSMMIQTIPSLSSVALALGLSFTVIVSYNQRGSLGHKASTAAVDKLVQDL